MLILQLDDGIERLPEGSRPTRCHNLSPTLPNASVSVKTFEMLWIENGTSAIAACGDVVSAIDDRHPESFRIDARRVPECKWQRRRDRGGPHLLGNFQNCGLES